MTGAQLRPLAISARTARARIIQCQVAPTKLPQSFLVLQRQCITRAAPFSTSLAWRSRTRQHAEADAPNKRRYEREDKDARKTAQRIVDDRPWHRENSPSQPEATSADPAGGDSSKGTAHRGCISDS